MQTFGGDFEYTHADMNYGNLDQIFSEINTQYHKYNMNISFSTPDHYIKQKFRENLFFPIKYEGDFFPYRDGSNAFWTGFYTSRVNFKLEVR